MIGPARVPSSVECPEDDASCDCLWHENKRAADLTHQVLELPDTLHTCSCGRRYTAAEWQALRLVGYQAAEDPDEILQLRTCAEPGCDSTRAVPVPGPGYWLGRAIAHTQAAQASARREMLSSTQWSVEQAAVCLRQANELTALLVEQRKHQGNEAQDLFEAAVQYEPRSAFV